MGVSFRPDSWLPSAAPPCACGRSSASLRSPPCPWTPWDRWPGPENCLFPALLVVRGRYPTPLLFCSLLTGTTVDSYRRFNYIHRWFFNFYYSMPGRDFPEKNLSFVWYFFLFHELHPEKQTDCVYRQVGQTGTVFRLKHCSSSSSSRCESHYRRLKCESSEKSIFFAQRRYFAIFRGATCTVQSMRASVQVRSAVQRAGRRPFTCKEDDGAGGRHVIESNRSQKS